MTLYTSSQQAPSSAIDISFFLSFIFGRRYCILFILHLAFWYIMSLASPSPYLALIQIFQQHFDERAPAVNINDLDKDDRQCNICTAPYRSGEDQERPIRLPCGHVFGRDCILEWLSPFEKEYHNSCPTCRANIVASWEDILPPDFLHVFTRGRSLVPISVIVTPRGFEILFVLPPTTTGLQASAVSNAPPPAPTGPLPHLHQQTAQAPGTATALPAPSTSMPQQAPQHPERPATLPFPVTRMPSRALQQSGSSSALPSRQSIREYQGTLHRSNPSPGSVTPTPVTRSDGAAASARNP